MIPNWMMPPRITIKIGKTSANSARLCPRERSRVLLRWFRGVMNSYSNRGVGTEVPLASCWTNLTDELAVLRLCREKYPRGSPPVAYRDEWAIVPPHRAVEHSPHETHRSRTALVSCRVVHGLGGGLGFRLERPAGADRGPCSRGNRLRGSAWGHLESSSGSEGPYGTKDRHRESSHEL